MGCIGPFAFLTASLLAVAACGTNSQSDPPEDPVFGVDPVLRPYPIGHATQVAECEIPSEEVSDLPDEPRLFLTRILVDAVLDPTEAEQIGTIVEVLTIERGDEAWLPLLSRDQYEIGFSTRNGIATREMVVPAAVTSAVQGCGIPDTAIAIGVEEFFHAKNYPEDWGNSDVQPEAFTGEPYYLEGAILQVREDEACFVSRWHDELEGGSPAFSEQESGCIKREGFERGVIRASEM
jgi:hypothetical protein